MGANLAGLRAAADRLGARLLRAAPADRNAVVSAPGVQLLLGLAYLGAGPSPVDELLGGPGTDRDAALGEVLGELARLAPTAEALAAFDPGRLPEQPLLHLAQHALFVAPLAPAAAYRRAAGELGAEVDEAAPTAAQAELDGWVARHTGGLIRRSAVAVDELTRVVLQSAILLAARWELPFNPAATLRGVAFHRAAARPSSCDLMVATSSFVTVAGERWRALRVPYAAGSGLALDVVLPDEGSAPADLPPQTWAEATSALTERGAPEWVKLLLPRLELSAERGDLAAQLGVRLPALDHIAPGLPLAQLAQQARLIVDEEGTVAAAVTELMVAAGWPLEQPMEFRVDRPHVLRVIDLASGLALLEALVQDPSL